jgi:hypothetical protein
MLAVVALLQTMGRRWPWPLVLLAAAVVVATLAAWIPARRAVTAGMGPSDRKARPGSVAMRSAPLP